MKHTDDRDDKPQREFEEKGSPMVLLLEAAQGVQDRMASALAEVGLTPAKYQAIDALARAGEPLTLSEFAGRLQCVRSNITQLVDRLEADGLVERVDDPSDRRAIRAVVTPLGVERRAAGTEVMNRLRDEFAARIAPADRALLQRVLGTLR
jgi:DNA-binding MarR family transcriptional regulator